jgi:hypothetical protein
MRLFFFLFGLSAFVMGLGACPKSCSSKTDTSTRAAKPSITDFPNLDLGKLSDAKKNAFSQIVNSEICPCGCAKTFAECLMPDVQCEPARLLAGWIIRMLEDDAPEDKLAVAISHEITDGFTAKQVDIDTKGFARKGNIEAKNVIVEFADFQCAYCKVASEELTKLAQKKDAEFSFVFKHLPLDLHNMAKKSALAVEAAANQGKFWDMHLALFMNQTRLNDKLIDDLAGQVGLKMSQFRKDMQSRAVTSRVEQSIEEAHRLGIHATPAIFINGRPYHLIVNEYNLSVRLAMEKAREQMKCTP